MMFGYVLVSHPDGRQQAIPLRAGTLRIGSAPDNDLVLAGHGIAPRHATIRCDDEGDLLITIGGCGGQASAAVEIELPRAFATAMLARVGGYALRYQPAARPTYGRPQADQWMDAPAAAPSDEHVTLLGDLLDQRIVWVEAAPERAGSHEAVTIEMQALRGVTIGER
jgi:hypothetical protein